MTSPSPDSSPTPMPRIFIALWLLALMGIAAFIRLHGAGDYYYSPDEAMHTSISSGNTLAEVLTFAHDEIHPPVLYILTHYWMTISTDPAFVRALQLLFGLLTIPLYYAIGKRLNGPMTGMCCALLIAFSTGCIIQSYVVRHYMMLITFISIAFYYYLVWRETKRAGALILYAACATIACLTHFSAIFDVACIGGFEMILELLSFPRKRESSAKTPAFAEVTSTSSQLSRWVLVNAIIAVIALYAYHLWQPILVPLKSYFTTHVEGSFALILLHALFYPIATPGYILPGYASALILLGVQVWVAIAPPRAIHNLPGLRRMLALLVLAYGLGMLLVITRIYPEPGTRHSMWVLPFVIATAGWILADLAEWLASSALPGQAYALPAAACLLLALGALTYDAHARFHDGSEYVWPQTQWHDFSDYMQKLGPHDLIVTEKDDGIMLSNLYIFMGDGATSGEKMAALAYYGNTHILFNPYYPRNYSRHLLLATLEEARARHMLDGTDRLVFLRMAWSRSPLTDLMLCPAVRKEIVTFPPSAPEHVFTRNDILGKYVALMIVDKEPFLSDVLSPDGKTRACLTGEYDKVPDLVPPHWPHKGNSNQRLSLPLPAGEGRGERPAARTEREAPHPNLLPEGEGIPGFASNKRDKTDFKPSLGANP